MGGPCWQDRVLWCAQDNISLQAVWQDFYQEGQLEGALEGTRRLSDQETSGALLYRVWQDIWGGGDAEHAQETPL